MENDIIPKSSAFHFTGTEEKQDCVKVLLNEQQALCHQAAENCSSSPLKSCYLSTLDILSHCTVLIFEKPESEDSNNSRTISETHSITPDLKSNVSSLTHLTVL